MHAERKDSTEDRLDRLFAEARKVPVDVSAVERGFETRFMARLKERLEQREPWYAWGWRLAPVFFAATVLLVVLSLYQDPGWVPDSAAIYSGTAHEQIALVDHLTGE